MARKHTGWKTKNFSMTIAGLEEFANGLSKAPATIKSKLLKAADSAGIYTKKQYVDNIRRAMGSAADYSDGFKSHPKHNSLKATMKVEWLQNDNGLTIFVGHESYLAKFLEAGTSAHDIPHKSRNGKKVVYSHVKGIKGSKAASKAFEKKHDQIAADIRDLINNILNNIQNL